ncbi:MAG: glycosyltransferase family 9 protein [Sphingobacteriales bacterium]|jgi:ADP-heptose:LPS heptosyltransferase|nr:MAG: glycosyltransferase family 9 protein [Sphingobacteriales bacterium]
MKILIIRFSSIGDIVLTSPIIRCIKKQISSAEIHFITKDIYKEIVENNIYVQKVYSINKHTDEVINELKNEQYDVIVDLHKNIRSFQIIKSLKAKQVYSYNKQTFKRWLLTSFKINLLNNHVVDRYFSAVKKLNIINDAQGLDFFIPEEKDIPIGNLPFTHIAGFIVIVIGAKHYTKTIPKHHLEYLCKEIKVPIILIGGKEDETLGNELSQIDAFKIMNACGRFSITQSASIIKRAKYVITGDTGMMHIATAFQKKIISVWGSTDKKLGFIPYQNTSNTVIIENHELKCRPCNKYGSSSCPKKHFKCMEDLDMQKIVDILS